MKKNLLDTIDGALIGIAEGLLLGLAVYGMLFTAYGIGLFMRDVCDRVGFW